KGQGMVFCDPGEVLHAHAEHKVGVHAAVTVRLPVSKYIEGGSVDSFGRLPTTVGRVLFNDLLHPGLPFYNLPMTFRQLEQVVLESHRLLGRLEAIQLLDRIKHLGFQEATRSGLSFTLEDLRQPSNKMLRIQQTEEAVAQIEAWYRRGLMTAGDRS